VRDSLRDPARDRMRDRAQRLRGALPALVQRLNLTEAQKTQLRTIMQEQREKRKALAESRLTAAERREKAQAWAQETRERVMSILTPEQRQQLQQMRQGRPGQGRPGQARPEA